MARKFGVEITLLPKNARTASNHFKTFKSWHEAKEYVWDCINSAYFGAAKVDMDLAREISAEQSKFLNAYLSAEKQVPRPRISARFTTCTGTDYVLEVTHA